MGIVEAAVLAERKRLIKLVETFSDHKYDPYIHNCNYCELIFLINDRNVL